MKEFLIFGLAMTFATAGVEAESKYEVEEVIEVAPVVSEFRVRFCLLTSGNLQYVAYYDENRQMTVAARALDSEKWEYQVLPSKIGWDSHNYITMAVDRAGCLHVSGNMHADPLVYFRTEKAGDISTLTRHQMTGEAEGRATYPNFLKDAEGQLIFNYRDGGSGRGKRIYNKYDPSSKNWERLIDTPLLDGEGERNAYPSGPRKGPDGWYHMIWVWRDTPDCATNHHLSYARSRDLKVWESAFGEQVKLPIVLRMKELWVDPVPAGGGLINGGAGLSFDSKKRPVISYHKADEAGKMQVYAARPEDGSWSVNRLTDWDEKVEFGGRGSMGDIGIKLGRLESLGHGLLAMNYRHRDYGQGRLFVEEKTLERSERRKKTTEEFPVEISRLESEFEGMSTLFAGDSGGSEDDPVRYLLKWESLGSNHDRPRSGPLPEPSALKLYKLRLRK